MKTIQVLILILCFNYSKAQISFEAVFNSTGNHEEGIGCKNINMGYVAGGIIIPCYPCQEGVDYLRIDSLGNLATQHYYPLNMDGFAYILHIIDQNNLMIAGQMINYVSNEYDMFLQKIDLSGTLIWQKQFVSDTMSSILPKSICNTVDSGYFVDFISASEGVHFMKIDSNGDSVFTKKLGYPFHAGVFISPLHDSDFVMLATRYDSSLLNYSIIKINAAGDTLWTKSFARDTLGVIMKIIETTDYGFAAIANINGHGGLNPLCIIRFDSLGNAMWCKPFYTAFIEDFTDISACSDGGFITAGVTIDSAGNTSRGFMYRTNSNGDSLWFREYETFFNTSFNSVFQTADLGFMACGTIGGYNGLPPSLLIVKTDSLGNVSSTLGIPVAEVDKSLKIFPSPAINYLHIDQKNSCNGTIIISDIRGNTLLKTTVNNSGEVNLNVSMLHPGFYFIALQTDDGVKKASFIKM